MLEKVYTRALSDIKRKLGENPTPAEKAELESEYREIKETWESTTIEEELDDIEALLVLASVET